MGTIYVHAEKGGKHGKVEGNIPPKTNDYLWMVHEN
jgi:hypothetical protein